MFICICNGHRESEIRAAAESGLRSARDVYLHLGKPPRCGRCLTHAAELVKEVHAASADPQPAAELCS